MIDIFHNFYGIVYKLDKHYHYMMVTTNYNYYPNSELGAL